MANAYPLLQTLRGSLAFFLFWALLLLPCAAVAGSAATIHDLLRDHGLPAGVLPRTVRSFALDPSTGLLEARLDAPCYARWRDNPVYFDRVVSGNLSYGELKGVEGLSQEELFLWLPVRGILVADPSSGVLFLDIGVARKQLSLSLFEEPPDCVPADGEAEGQGLLPESGSGLKQLHGRTEGRPQHQRWVW